VTLLNVWASWCAACVEEHPVLSAWVKRRRLPLVGLNYKDDPEQARAWLVRFGNPFHEIAVDRDGRVGIDWGVYGVPETFVIDRAGIIRYKHIGPLTPQVIAEKLDPLIDTLQRAGGAP
jgi:cytochrome c biogenesis protein CcmG/thiol:disulfide interchange protein DsbE